MSENFQNQTFVQNENKGKKNDADYVENVHITVLCSCCMLRDDQETIMTSLLTYLISLSSGLTVLKTGTNT